MLVRRTAGEPDRGIAAEQRVGADQRADASQRTRADDRAAGDNPAIVREVRVADVLLPGRCRGSAEQDHRRDDEQVQ